MKIFTRVWLAVSLLAVAVGAVIVIVVALTGARWKNVYTRSFYEAYDDIKSLDFDFAYGKVTIKEGDSFSIAAENVPEKIFKSYVKDGVWHIKEKYGILSNVFGGNIFNINIFGFKMGYSSREITITVPKDFIAEECRLDIGAGEVEAETIYAKEGYFKVGAGKLDIKRLEITGKSEYEVGAGSMAVKNLTAYDTKFDCGVGEIEINGILRGENVIKCGVGRISLDLKGNEKDYSYKLVSGLGNVVIDSQSYHRVNKSIDNNSDNLLILECGIGSIDVDFH